jgi:hypothetical protein
VAAFLLYPTLQWINWWHFHPDALIVAPSCSPTGSLHANAGAGFWSP